jgi:hypothetical protein
MLTPELNAKLAGLVNVAKVWLDIGLVTPQFPGSIFQFLRNGHTLTLALSRKRARGSGLITPLFHSAHPANSKHGSLIAGSCVGSNTALTRSPIFTFSFVSPTNRLSTMSPSSRITLI